MFNHPLEVGDRLHAEDGFRVVVCGFAGGPALARMCGTVEEPDLVVARGNPWACDEGAGPALPRVRVRVRSSELLGQEVTARAWGEYTMITSLPAAGEGRPHTAQLLEAKDFAWLLAAGACHLAIEIYGPRGDCIDWRQKLADGVLLADRGVFHLDPPDPTGFHSLSNSPSESVRYFENLLRAVGVRSVLQEGALSFRLLSDHERRAESFGQVKLSETIHYRTLRPEKDGLFCERIFGPDRDWECGCGKYSGMNYKGRICERCGVKVDQRGVRRTRTGHIELAAPVVHPWFFRRSPAVLGLLLGMPLEDLERVIYYQDYAVVDPGVAPFQERQILNEGEYRQARERFGDGFRVELGAIAIRELLKRLDLQARTGRLREELAGASDRRPRDLIRQLKVVQTVLARRPAGINLPAAR